MPILWRPQLAIGNAVIDRDHKYLFCLINSLELTLKHPEDKEDLELILDQLAVFALEHFEREEKLQKRSNYPYCLEHKREHQALLKTLTDIAASIKSLVETPEQSSAHYVEEIDKTIILVRHWLLYHVLKTDMGLKTYLADLPKATG